MNLAAQTGHDYVESLDLEISRDEGMKLVGYARVEPNEDGLEEQEVRLIEFGCGRVFPENHSGVRRKAAKRSQGMLSVH